MKKLIRVVELDKLSETKQTSSDETIIVCDQLSSDEVLSFCLNNKVNHIVQKSNVDMDTEIKSASSMIDSPNSFIKFPISVILGADNPSAETEQKLAEASWTISNTDQKAKILDGVEQYVNNSSSLKSLGQDVRMVADELVSNCIYNAPQVDLDNSFSGPRSADDKISIDPSKKPQVFIGRDQSRIVLGCTDFYGRLNIKKMIERIHLCYLKNLTDMVSFGPGGAQIGCYLIFESCMSFYVAVDLGKSTTVACVFPRKMSSQKRHVVPKNLHILVTESSV